jgi:serine/threonine-protein kinase
MSLETGQIVDGKYKIVRLLGTGGMGAVYEGENTRIRRRVAIKVLHASISQAAESVARFEREAQAAARIGSDHICEVLDLGVLPDGSRYMVMEYLDGETLGARIKRAYRLTPAQGVAIMTQVLDALGAAHAAGIVHRDLKPDNIFILPSKAGRTDYIKILDFGVSKFSQLSGETGDEFNVTRAGSVIGTPYYMSPEQARGMATVDGRSDIYAIGVVLYQATTGQVPFRAETFNELLFKIALEVPPPPQHFVPDIDPEFSAIIQRAMSREQTHRFQTCAEFRDALLAWQATKSAGAPFGAGAMASPHAGPQMRPSMPMVPPFTQTQPPPMSVTPQPGALGGINTPQPQQYGEGAQATGNAWGNASSTVNASPPKPQSSMALVSVLVGVVALGGLGVAGYLFFGKKDSGHAGDLVATAAPTSAPTPAPTPTTPPEPKTPEAPKGTAADSPAASAGPTAPPTPSVGLSAKPAGSFTIPGPKPSASSKTNKNNGGGTDFGY